jgi:hypothetical protein
MGFKMPMAPNYGKEGNMDLVATHQRSLVCAAMRTTGPMLELGVGWYSTTILHEIAEAQHRWLLTVDNIDYWLAQFKPLQSEYHRFADIGWWGDLDKVLGHQRFGLCFVDQGQPIEREYAIRKLIDRVDVFVMHDTEEGHAYGYSRTLPMFKHQCTDDCQQAWTTIASNKVDVSNWLLKLPKVEPSMEVT